MWSFQNVMDYKEEFYKLLELSLLEEFQSLIERLKKSEIKECIYLSKTYRNWREKILNSIE